MKGRVLVLDEIGGRPAAALLVDGQIEELAIDPEATRRCPVRSSAPWPTGR
jgi:ribonuclease G